MPTPRVVLVTRRTEYAELLDRHGTRGQVEFFLRARGQGLEAVLHRHTGREDARRAVLAAIPADWRRAEADRAELSRFVFEPADIVVALGPDGLVANVAKYLAGQPVIGVDPTPGQNAGVLVPHAADAVAGLLADVAAGRAAYLDRRMVEVRTDDGQSLRALNDVYVGQAGHQSARYELTAGPEAELQSSSGVVIGTGTGASGWSASIQRVLAPDLVLPRPAEAALAWFVREAWPSPTTGTHLVAGRLEGSTLAMRSCSEQLVAFGDGIEGDRLLIGWGQQITIGVSDTLLRTVV
jgi:hypothetical protein